ncbi:MAG: type II toxin-antitoxin system antitoxin SocA domain-containing protein [Rhizobiaceae bacterium]
MIYDARQVANWFLNRAQGDGKSLSIMSLLKLTYIAHGWFLQMRNQPLFTNKIEAWQYGPVMPDVYNAFRSQGVRLKHPVPVSGPQFMQQDVDFLEQIYEIYGGMSPFKLSDLTHEVGGPWHISRQVGGSYAEIPNDLIKSHYDMKRMKGNQTDLS